jgi:PAS domain S-box-containing protein
MKTGVVRCSILVVEDEPIVAKDLQLILRDQGYDAFAIASSADDAIKRAAERCPDLVLMDIRIKGKLDGIQTAEILRRRFGVAVVYLTAHADEATIERAARSEPYGYLLKPIKAAELRSAIEIAAYKQNLDKKIRERERWFSTALQSVRDAVIASDSAGQLTFVNSAAEELLGARADALIGKPASEVLKSLNRDSIVAETSTVPAEVDRDSSRGVQPGSRVMVLHDVGERRKLEKQLELADRLSSLGAMAASTAHELNNPLTVVMTNSGILSEDLGTVRRAIESADIEAVRARLVKMVDSVGDLQAAASRMARIVGNLRAFSRPADNGPELVELRHCVEWAVRATAHEFQHRAHIRTHFERVPAVMGEPARIEQVLVNLLVNAAQAIPPGNVEDNDVHIVLRTAEDGRALIEVRDTGGGIPEHVVDKIFDPFFTTKAPGVGTGLGLAICHGIIKALGGEIRVASQMGLGTTFTILLDPAPSAALEAPLVPEALPPESPPGRILIIDDEVTLLRAMQHILEDDGHEVVCLERASAALSLLDQGESFDLIISDLMMPTMTGMDLYAQLQANHPAMASRVLFITGGAITRGAAIFLETVPNPRLEKPFKITQLCTVVRKALVAALSGELAAQAPKHVN